MGEIDGQKGTAGPGDDKGREFYNGEGEEFPRSPEVDEDAFPRVGGRRVDSPLRSAGCAFSQPGNAVVVGGGGGMMGVVIALHARDVATTGAFFRVLVPFICENHSASRGHWPLGCMSVCACLIMMYSADVRDVEEERRTSIVSALVEFLVSTVLRSDEVPISSG